MNVISTTLYYLLKFDYSLNCIEKLSKENISLVGAMYSFKANLMLKKDNRYKYIALVNFIKESKIKLEESILDSIFLLAQFDVSIIYLQRLYELGYTTVSQLRNDMAYVESANLILEKHLNKIKKVINKPLVSEKEKLELYTFYYISSNRSKSESELIQYLNQYFDESKVLTFIKNQIELNTLERYKNKLIYHELSIQEVIELDMEEIEMVRDKLNGLSLQAIGDRMNLTRERVRQKLERFFTIFTSLKEDKYIDVFTKYDLSREDFNIVYGDEMAYNYLSVRFSRGSLPIEQFVEDINLSKSIKQILLRNHNLMYCCDGRIITITINNLFSLFLSQKEDRYYTIDELKDEFEVFASKYLTKREVKTINLRSVHDRNDTMIRTNNLAFRFYLPHVDDEIVAELNKIMDLKPGIYGTPKIYHDNLDLMKKLDLRDGYELADYINRYVGLERIPNVVAIQRRAEIQIGSIDKNTFIRNSIEANVGKHIHDVIRSVCKKYGLLYSSTLSYVYGEFSDLLTDNIIVLKEQCPHHDVVYPYLEKNLIEDFYMFKNLQQQIKKDINIEIPFVPKMLLKKLGYTIDHDLVYKDKYTGIVDVLSHVIYKEQKLDLSENRFPNSSTLYMVVRKLEKEFKLFKVNQTLYITDTLLFKKGINKKMILDFIEKIYAFGDQFELYTLPFLMNQGFEHPLLTKDVPFQLIERLLINDERFSYLRNLPLFFSNFKKLDRGIVYNTIINIHQCKNFEEFVEILRNTYGCANDNRKIKQSLIDYNIDLEV